MSKTTAIPLREETREKLDRYRKGKESYDETISRLIEYLEGTNFEEYIEARYERLKREKDEFVKLEEVIG